MYTLQEFMYHTKAWEYVIVILFIVAFIAFWWLLTNVKDRGAESAEGDRGSSREDYPSDRES